MIISIIAAVTENNVIGANGNLPFKQKDDLLRFKFLTTNNVVIMGRKTFESMGSKPLPNRTNIVISHNAQTRAPVTIAGRCYLCTLISRNKVRRKNLHL
jgi:dihydrofolate reductase